MPFAPKIKEDALLASARRCAVCKKYNGVGVEVHHIVAEASGGPNTFDNAIVLCFDCHMSAGHYNAKHPRGTKFSPSELRRHRDDWYKRVRDSKTSSLDQEFHDYYSRHLVSSDRGAAQDCLNLNRKDIPFTVSYLHKNAVTAHMSWVLNDEQYPDGSAPARLIGPDEDIFAMFSPEDDDKFSVDGYSYHSETGSSFKSEAEFHSSNLDMKGQSERLLTNDDLDKTKLNSNFLRQAFAENYDVSKLGKVICHHQPCDGCWEKIYVARKQLFIFAEIRNIGSEVITITEIYIQESGQKGTLDLRELRADTVTNTKEKIPHVRLEPLESFILPEMVLLSPESGISVDTAWESELQDTSNGRTQILGHYFGLVNHDEYLIAGPRRSLIGLGLRKDGEEHVVSIHEFDPTNTHLFYRFWEMGSCPHLFFHRREGGWYYAGEILVDAFERVITETVDIPKDVDRAIIAELEHETTTINFITNGSIKIIDSTLLLEQGYEFEFPVEPDSTIVVSGFYQSKLEKQRGYDDIWLKTALVGDFLEKLNHTSVNQNKKSNSLTWNTMSVSALKLLQ